jgi:hypothetical protein
MLGHTMPRRLLGILQVGLRVAGRRERNWAARDRGNSALPPSTTLRRKFSTSCTLSHTTREALCTPDPRVFKCFVDIMDYLIPKEDIPRTLFLHNLPVFAIEEDLRQLFEESGFPV